METPTDRPRLRCAWLALAFALAAPSAAAAAPVASFPVQVEVDARAPGRPLPPIWRFFGADEPNSATTPQGAALLGELGALRPGEVYFRAHNLMTSGDGAVELKWGSTNLYTERDGHAVYDWTIVDRIIDAYRAEGIHPYLEIGFMPEALSAAPPGAPYHLPWRQDAKAGAAPGWTYPPADDGKWAEAVYQWVRHCVARYGRAEVERWWFEVWNEANLGFYWSGTPEQFYRLHDLGVAAVRRALPTARVGGPDSAGADAPFFDRFLAHVTEGRNFATGAIGTPTDFISFHAKGQPTLVAGHMRMGLAAQLRTADEGFAKIAAIPALRERPVVIGENDPDGCAACRSPQLAYRNKPIYAAYEADAYARLWSLAERRGVNLQGALTWSYTFVDQPWFAGYRQLATNGVDLPVMNVFRLFARLGPERIMAVSDHEAGLDKVMAAGVSAAPDVGALATRGPGGRVAVLLWHYDDDDLPGPAARVRLKLAGVGAARQARLWRIDETHGDAYDAWLRMGAPQSPTPDEVAQLKAAASLAPETAPITAGQIELTLPRQGVALLEIAPGGASGH